jgi:O-antigen/teichoic acid export membrane protein
VAGSRLGRTFAALFGSQVIARVIRLAYVFVIARFVSTTEMGAYQFALAFYLAIGVFAELGQGARLSAEAPAATDLAGMIAVSRAVLAVATLLSAAVGAAYVVLGVPAGVVEPALVCLVALVARTYAFWVRNCFVAIEDAGWIPRYELIFRVAEVAAGVAVLALGGGVVGLCAVHAVGWVIEAAYSHRLLTRRFGALPRVREASSLTRAARDSIVFLVSSSVMPLYWQLGLVVLTSLLGETHAVGQLGVALQLLTVVATVPMTLGAALVPAIARVRLTSGNELRALQTVLKLALLVGGMLAPLVAGTAAWILVRLVGPAYGEAAQSLVTLAWTLAPYAGAQLAVSALNGLGKHRAAAIVAVTVVGVHLVAIPLLWSLGPLPAVEWSLVLGASVGCAIGLWALGEALEPRGHVWWLAPALLVAAAGAWFRFAYVPGTFVLAPVAIAAIALALRVIRRDELRTIADYVGRRAR